jgi:hypothetical protein
MELLNFKSADNINEVQAVVTKEIVEEYPYAPMNYGVLVLKPEVSKTTKGGIQKSDSQIAEELKKMDAPMTVLAVSEEAAAIGLRPNAKVVTNRFTATNLPSPIEGFDVVMVRVPEIIAYDKTALTL